MRTPEIWKNRITQKLDFEASATLEHPGRQKKGQSVIWTLKNKQSSLVHRTLCEKIWRGLCSTVSSSLDYQQLVAEWVLFRSSMTSGESSLKNTWKSSRIYLSILDRTAIWATRLLFLFEEVAVTYDNLTAAYWSVDVKVCLRCCTSVALRMSLDTRLRNASWMPINGRIARWEYQCFLYLPRPYQETRSLLKW